MRLVRAHELRQEGEEEDRQLRIEDVDQDGGDDHLTRRAGADLLFDPEGALLPQRVPGHIEKIGDAQVLEGVERERARVQERCEPHDRRGHVWDDAQSASEGCDDACAGPAREAGCQRIENAGAGRDHDDQRRHQKLVEESPSPAIDAKRRKELGTKVVKALEAIEYTNAGTVEFLMDTDGSLYFIEMNTRIQVEHPVTEFVTGVDLVKSQIRIAAGEKMEDAVGEMHFSGHSIECRINAEDPETFVPSAGRITTFQAPGGTGVRVDSAAYSGAVIPPYYDSLVAKLIVKGRDRTEAIGRMKRALEMFVIEGIKTSIPLQRRIMADADFEAGKFDTHFIEKLLNVNGK